MDSNSEKRTHERTHFKAPIMYAQYPENQYCFYGAQLCNYSKGGLYFESPYAVQKGMLITIRRANYAPESTGKSIYTELQAKVQWRRKIVSLDQPCYGVGVKYLEPIADPPAFKGALIFDR